MYQQVTVTMSMRELDRLKVIQAVVAGELRVGLAAERLEMCSRQVRRLAQRYRAEGPVGLISRRRNQPSNRRLHDDVENHVARILRDQYPDLGPTLAMEKLAERQQIVLAKETVRRIQIAAGLWIPRRLRPPKVQQPRLRRACVGELIQIDGCEHAWFEDRATMCTALVFVDDATSRLMCVRFADTESTFTYFEALRDYLGRYGKPLALYSDKASIFRVNRPGAATGRGHTQFARALYELNIDGICANTPAAKGRVERAHKTLQDRLVKELRLAGISSIEAANALMPTFIETHNRKFAKVPRDAHDAHRPVRPDEDLDLHGCRPNEFFEYASGSDKSARRCHLGKTHQRVRRLLVARGGDRQNHDRREHLRVARSTGRLDGCRGTADRCVSYWEVPPRTAA